MKKHLILAMLSVILVNCGSVAERSASNISSVEDGQSQNNNANQSNDVKAHSRKQDKGKLNKSKNGLAKKNLLNDSVFAKQKNGLTGEVLHYLMVAEIAGQRGKLGAAVANYLQAAKISQDPSVAERASRIAIFARKNAAALEAAMIWVKLAPQSADAHQIVAAMLVRNGDIDNAINHFEKVLTLSTKGEQKTFMLIMSLLGKERDKTIALDIMKRLIEKHKNSPSAYYSYAHLALLTKEYDIANNAVDKALKLKKDWFEAIILKSTILSRIDLEDKAQNLLVHYLKRKPNNHALRLYYARKLVDAKKHKQAYKQFEKVYKANKDSNALYAMGLLANRLEKIDLAERHFKKMLETGSRENEVRFYFGQIYEKKKEFSTAIDWYSRVQSGVYAFESRLRIVVLLGKQGKVTQAREQISGIKTSKPSEQVRLYIVEGEVLRENKKYQEALELYTEGLISIPDNADLLYARALINEKLNKIEDAISDLKAVVKLDPQSVQALNALGYTMVDKTNRIHEGLEYIKQAYQLEPEDPAIIDSMGWAHYRLGNLDQAVEFLKRAYEALNDAEVAAHLGEVLWVRGDKDKARKIWKNSLRDAPEHDTLLNVIKRFMP